MHFPTNRASLTNVFGILIASAMTKCYRFSVISMLSFPLKAEGSFGYGKNWQNRITLNSFVVTAVSLLFG